MGAALWATHRRRLKIVRGWRSAGLRNLQSRRPIDRVSLQCHQHSNLSRTLLPPCCTDGWLLLATYTASLPASLHQRTQKCLLPLAPHQLLPHCRRFTAAALHSQSSGFLGGPLGGGRRLNRLFLVLAPWGSGSSGFPATQKLRSQGALIG